MIVRLRYDGCYAEWPECDNLSFTFMSHFIGADGRDYYMSSWTGIENVLKSGVELDDLRIDVDSPIEKC